MESQTYGAGDGGAALECMERERPVLREIDLEPVVTAARELGITAGGSKSQLFKARAKLRKLLAHLIDLHTPSAGTEHVAPSF